MTRRLLREELRTAAAPRDRDLEAEKGRDREGRMRRKLLEG